MLGFLYASVAFVYTCLSTIWGFLWAFFAWAWFFLFWGTCITLFVLLVGDLILTKIIQKTASAFIKEDFQISWSIFTGKFAMNNFQLTQKTIDIINPVIHGSAPADLQMLQLKHFSIQLEVLKILSGMKNAFAGIRVEGFNLDLSMHHEEKWMWRSENNAERFKQAVLDAGVARIGRANVWTQTIVQKLAELAKETAPVAAAESTTAAPAEAGTSTVAQTESSTPAEAATPAWKLKVDAFIDSFQVIVKDVNIGIHWEHDKSMGIKMKEFLILPAATPEEDAKVRVRPLQMTEFGIFVNSGIVSGFDYLVGPIAMDMGVTIPAIMQSLMAPTPGRHVARIKIDIPDVSLRIMPKQASALLALLTPLNAHAAWWTRAAKDDKQLCEDLTEEDIAEYKKKYAEHFEFENKVNPVTRFIALKRDPSIQGRIDYLDGVEKTLPDKAILALRYAALNWEIPSAGKAAPNVSLLDKKEADFEAFLVQPVTCYYEPKVAEPMVHSAQVIFLLERFSLQTLRDDGRPLFDFFVTDFSVHIDSALEQLQPEETYLTLSLAVGRFGIKDLNENSTSAFKTILDRNPDASQVVITEIKMRVDGHIDLVFKLADFSLLVILDPFMQTMREFECVMEEEEKEIEQQLLELEEAEELRREVVMEALAKKTIYEKDLPAPYTPLLLAPSLGDMTLTATIAVEGWELCLLGDPTAADSYVLALTSDVKLAIDSEKKQESIVLQLEDVALQPCTVKVTEDALDLEISGLRTILELEGEGTDLELKYQVDVNVVEAKETEEARDKEPSSSKSDASALMRWSAVRSAINKVEELEKNLSPRSGKEMVLPETTPPVEEHVPADAIRTISIECADLALNFSKDDIGVLLGVQNSVFDAMKEDPEVEKARLQKAERLAAARKEADQRHHSDALKQAFQELDEDNGGSLDSGELEALLRKAMKDNILIKSEFDETVKQFIHLVDRDGSGDVSFEEFVDVLNPENIPYDTVHQGTVMLTAQEYVNPTYKRSAVPTLGAMGTLSSASTFSASNTVLLANFWKKYEEQSGATRTSLNHQPALVVQKKLIRIFGNYEFAQEAWIRLVNPSLTNPLDRKPWLVTRGMEVEGKSSILDELLSNMVSKAPEPPVTPLGKPMFVETVVDSKFGGCYIRVIDSLLPLGVPSIEFATEDILVKCLASQWEGADDNFPSAHIPKADTRRSSLNAKFGFTIAGRYYNSHVRQIEPFLEPYQGILSVDRKDTTTDEAAPIAIKYSSDKYFHLNVTAAFMDTIKTNLANFSSIEVEGQRERQHIDELRGVFWMKNSCGSPIQYWIVTEKEGVYGVNTVESDRPLVENNDYHPCVMEDETEVLKAQKERHEKEKELRKAFREADKDGSGELGADEVKYVLQTVLAKDGQSDEDLDREVVTFMKLADTDGSGEISFEEFQIAVESTREKMKRTLSIQVEGYEPIEKVPIDVPGNTLVYELVPEFDPPLTGREDMETKYEIAQKLFLRQEPTYADICQAAYLFGQVVLEDPTYKWADSYLQTCKQQYSPHLFAFDLDVDGSIGMLVTVSSALKIRNSTSNVTELQLLDEEGEVSSVNPIQPNTSERFYRLQPKESIPVPVEYVSKGQFTIRQIGETEWSDSHLLSTLKEQQEKYKIMMEKEAKGNNEAEDELDDAEADALIPGHEKVWSSDNSIDGQPLTVIEKKSSSLVNNLWILSLQPQFIFQNSLPCDIEYTIAQRTDLPDQIQTPPITKKSKHYDEEMKAEATKWFDYVSEVNARSGIISSGKNVQVAGLDLDETAFMRVRLLCPEADKWDAETPADALEIPAWSEPFEVHLNQAQQAYDKHDFNVQTTKGPLVTFQQTWVEGGTRTLVSTVPYWIQNKSGLDLRFKLSKGTTLTWEEHQSYFGTNTKVPLLVNAPEGATLSIQPYRPTNELFDWNRSLSTSLGRYYPDFAKAGWSSAADISSVGYIKDFLSSDYALSYTVSVGPEQFNQTKLVSITPSFVLNNTLKIPLHLYPLKLDTETPHQSTAVPSKSSKGKQLGISLLEAGEAIILYKFNGSGKKGYAYRLRRTDMIEGIDGQVPSPWLPMMLLSNSDAEQDMWSREPLDDTALIRCASQKVDTMTISTIQDVSKAPAFRIENRSTSMSIRYSQVGVVRGEENLLKPLTWHSFSWQNPLSETPRVKVYVGNSRKPITVDILEVSKIGKVSPDDGRTYVYGEIYIDGSTRVLAFGDTKHYRAVRRGASKKDDMLANLSVDIGLHGFGMTIVDTIPREVMNITAEGIRLYSSPLSREISFSIHHVQIDDMTPNPVYPIFFAPLDTGLNSEKQEGWMPGDPEIPFFEFKFETLAEDGITIFNEFSINLGSMVNQVNLDYLLLIADVVGRFVPPSDAETTMLYGIDMKNTALYTDLQIPEHVGGMLLYFKRWFLSGFDFHFALDSNPDEAGSGIASIVGDTAGSLLGGIAHVTPEFSFKKIEFDNCFFYPYDLAVKVVTKIVFSVLGQWYKIVGSIELLGDPVGMASDIADGLALAVRQTKRELKGKSRKKGQGAITLAQAVVGAPMATIGKSSNAFGDMLKKATYFEDQEDEIEPRHVGEGLTQGGGVFFKSLYYGVSGLVTKPVEGAKEEGFKGFSKGIGKGAVRLVCSPVVGALGAVEKLSQSVHHTTHLGDEKYFDGTRRPARDLISAPLKTLPESNIISEMEVHIVKATSLPPDTKAKVYVYLMEHRRDGDIMVDRFKTSTIKHSENPVWDESRFFDLRSTKMYLDVHVYHKRRPIPRKLIGRFKLSVNEIYEKFEQIPEEILNDPRAKSLIRARSKKVKGSTFDQVQAEDVEITGLPHRNSIPENAQPVHSLALSEENDDIPSAAPAVKKGWRPKTPHAVPLIGPNGEDHGQLHLNVLFLNNMRM